MKLATSIFLLLFLTSFTLIKSENISLKQTVEKVAVSGGQISPDGKFIAHSLIVPRNAYADEDGKVYVQLQVTSIKGDVRTFIGGKVKIISPEWSADSQYIYYLAKRNKDEHTAVYRIPLTGGESKKLISINRDITAYSLNSDTTKLVYIAKPEQPKSVEKAKDKGFKAKVYEEAEINSNAYLVDLTDLTKPHEKMAIDDHVLSLAFHPSKDLLLMKATPTSLVDDTYTASQYRIYNTSGKLQRAFKTEGKLSSARWSKKGNKVAIIGAVNKNDPAAGRLYVGDVKTGKLSNVLKDYQGHVVDIDWVSDYQLAYLGNIGTQSEVSVINLDNQTIQMKIPPGDVVIRSIDVDSSGQVMVGFGSTDAQPRELYNLTDEQKQLTHSNAWLKDIELPEQQTISYLARDGIELQGVLIYPTNYKKNKRYPLIMMVHGGPESHIRDAWLDSYSYPIKYAASKGFAVFLPNYRGSTGRGVKFSKMGQADYAGAEFNDLVDAITHLDEIGLVDKKRVGITGSSYGGYASGWAATALSEHFAASVMFVGISDQLSKFGTTDIPKEMYNVHARNYPWDKWQWMLERSPIYHTDKAKTPLLIMHGDSDTRVHPSQSMELYRYIKTRTDTPVRLVFYPGEGHGNRKAAAQLDYSMRLMRWMEFYLKGDLKAKQKSKALPPYEIDHVSHFSKKKD